MAELEASRGRRLLEGHDGEEGVQGVQGCMSCYMAGGDEAGIIRAVTLTRVDPAAKVLKGWKKEQAVGQMHALSAADLEVQLEVRAAQ